MHPENALEFESHRGHLQSLAYRMLGSYAEAQDVVQDTWLRQKDLDPATLESPRAYLSRVATHLCLDRMQSARARREQYVGCWLPEPLQESATFHDPGPEAQLEHSQNVSVAFMLALERLSVLERAAFLLHDVFDLSFEEIAQRLDRNPAACRQLATRARKRLQSDGVRPSLEPEKTAQLLGSFVHAIASGNLEALTQLLTEDAMMVSDGGGIASAVPRPLEGGALVAKAIIGFSKLANPQDFQVSFERLNGAPAVVVYDLQGRAVQTATLSLHAEGRIATIYVVRNPQKLAHLQLPRT